MGDSKNIVINFFELRRSGPYREKICASIYQSKSLQNSIKTFVLKQGGQDFEVEEVFQEAMVRFFRKAIEVEFELETTPEAYIYGIARNVYYSKKKMEVPTQEFSTQNEQGFFDDHSDKKDVVNIAKEILQLTTETCRQVLIFWSQNYNMTQIASLMSYKSEMMARKKKHECLKKLIRFLKENPSITQKIIEHE
ncbi:MAG: sigma-70 family RNA polymerase sigma factor [Saprospiraceae bacterium]